MREKDLVTRFLLGWTVERESSLSRLDLILASSLVVKVLDGSIKVKQYQYIAWLHHWLVVASSALQRLSLSLSLSLSPTLQYTTTETGRFLTSVSTRELVVGLC